MGEPFRIDPDVALRAASAAQDQSAAVTSYLQSVDSDVADLLSTWRGEAARAYFESWNDLVDLLRAAATDLDDLGVRLSDSACRFVVADRRG